MWMSIEQIANRTLSLRDKQNTHVMKLVVSKCVVVLDYRNEMNTATLSVQYDPRKHRLKMQFQNEVAEVS